MKPAILLRAYVRRAPGVMAFALMALCVPAVGRGQALQSATPAYMLQGLQTVYLRSPILRFYTAEPATPAPIPPDDLALANLAVGPNRRLYPNLDRVRATVARDEALAAFLQDPRTGPTLRQAMQQATLYAALPRQGQAGFNEYNAMNSLPGNLRPNQAANRPGGIVRFGSVFGAASASNGVTGTASVGGSGASQGGVGGTTSDPAVKQPGFLGEVQRANPQGGAQGVGGGARIAVARQAALRYFTTMVVLSPDGRRANLYVLGSLPDSPNPAVGINFTMEAKQYANGDRDAAGLDRASSVTLLDKHALPTATESVRYFCFIYPLATPLAEIQSDLLASYWPDTAVAITHGVALAHADTPQTDGSGPAAYWITIPMTRLQYYPARRDTRHALLAAAEPGDPLILNPRRAQRNTK